MPMLRPGLHEQAKRAAAEVDPWVTWLVVAIVILPCRRVLGVFLSDVADTVGIHPHGTGSQHRRGIAGLLDLGYVAFFAIGAYMMGVLTSRNWQRIL